MTGARLDGWPALGRRLGTWRSRAPDERARLLARVRAEDGAAPEGTRFTLFIRDPEWEETPRARGWVKSEALARLLAEALVEEGLACLYVEDA